MRKLRFSMKTLLFVVTLAAVLLAWWVDHRRLTAEIEKLNGWKVFIYDSLDRTSMPSLDGFSN